MERLTTQQHETIRKVAIAGGLGLLAFIVYRTFSVPLGHDQASYLFEAQRLLSGAQPYGPHLSETNPPLIIWFSALPVWLAGWFHISAVFLLRTIVMAMLAGSIAWTVRLLRCASIIAPIGIALFAFVTLAADFGTGLHAFGQREHLLIILIIPYLLAAATGATTHLSITERCALGVAAGLAIWFKPHDILILIALEIFLALRHRSLRRLLSVEFFALLLTSLFLLFLVILFTPFYFKLTFPILVDVYWALGTNTTLGLFLSLYGYMALVAALLLVCYLLRRSLRDVQTTLALLVCSIAASFAFDLQHTDWPYHAYPHRALFLLALAYLVIDLADPIFRRSHGSTYRITPFVLAALAFAAVLVPAVIKHPQFVGYISKETPSDPIEVYLAHYSPPTTVYVFSTSVPPLSDAYLQGLNWGSRFAHMWMLPAIIQNERGRSGLPTPFKQLSPERTAELAALQRAQSTEDLNYWRPSVVLVQRCTPDKPCQGLEGKNFDMLAWLQQSPNFAAAWSHYQRQHAVDNYDVYKLAP